MTHTHSQKKNFLQRIKFGLTRLYAKLARQDILVSTLLKETNLFNHLNEAQFEKILQSLQVKKYQPNELILRQGDLADNLYIIQQGAVKIFTADKLGTTEIVLSRLEVGDYFGEQALLDETPAKRSASARAIQDTILIAIPHSAYVQILNEEVKSHLKKIGEQQLIEMLSKQLELYSSLNSELLKQFNSEMLTFKDGETIFKLHDEAKQVYFIVKGQVDIDIPDAKGEILTTQLSQGQIFGELGVLTNQKRMGTARAKSDLTVLAFDSEIFTKLYHTSSELQQLLITTENFYQIKHRGLVNVYHSMFLDIPAINAFFKLDDGSSVMSSRVIGKDIFTMSYNEIEGATTFFYKRGRAIRRELMIKDNKILKIMSVGKWDELPKICEFLLNRDPITKEQIELFVTEGLIFKRSPKIISSSEREETLCFCMNITKGQVFEAIRDGVNQIDELTKITGAGSVCGSCRPKIVEMLGLQAWRTVRLIEAISLHPDIRSFKFKFVDPVKLDYKPGQHIVIQALINGQFISRSYTLTSVSVQHDFIEITIKREFHGYFSNWLFEHAAANPLIRVSDPQGNFTLDLDRNKPIVCLMGGIGITPALAFARFIFLTNQNARLHIDYSAHSKKEFILIKEWEKMTQKDKNITINLRDTETQGQLQFDHIKELIRNLKNAEFYVCGPRSYEDAIVGHLKRLSIPSDKIRIEKFVHAGSSRNEMIEM